MKIKIVWYHRINSNNSCGTHGNRGVGNVMIRVNAFQTQRRPRNQCQNRITQHPSPPLEW